MEQGGRGRFGDALVRRWSWRTLDRFFVKIPALNAVVLGAKRGWWKVGDQIARTNKYRIPGGVRLSLQRVISCTLMTVLGQLRLPDRMDLGGPDFPVTTNKGRSECDRRGGHNSIRQI